jgi:hypothetical protein
MKFTELDMQCADAWEEFVIIAESDIRSAYGQTTTPRVPSKAAMAVYDEVVNREEAARESEP